MQLIEVIETSFSVIKSRLNRENHLFQEGKEMSKPRTDEQVKAAKKWSKRQWQEIRRSELKYAASGEWKTKGCFCGASPSEIVLVDSHVCRLEGNDRRTVRYHYKCIPCGFIYELEVKEDIR